jgi:DNA-binding CsgD family transcriptional regulator/PAS domain-containing protein
MTDEPGGPIDRVVERIYASIDDPVVWRSMLHEVTAVTDSTAGLLEVREGARTLLGVSLDRNEAGRAMAPALRATAIAWLEAGNPGVVQRSGDGRAIGGIFRAQRGHLGLVALFRPAAAEPFMSKEMRALETLLPHLIRAGLCGLRLQLAELRRRAAEAALECLCFGCVLVDGVGRVLFANPAALKLLDAGDGVRMVKDRLEASRPAERKELARLLSPGAAGERVAGGLLVTRGSSSRPPLRLLVIPLPLEVTPQAELASVGRTLIVISDPELHAVPSTAMLRTLHGLSDAEARLAVALARGERLADYAARSGVTLNTVRTHLKSAFVKTDTNSQTSLVRLLVLLSVARVA